MSKIVTDHGENLSYKKLIPEVSIIYTGGRGPYVYRRAFLRGGEVFFTLENKSPAVGERSFSHTRLGDADIYVNFSGTDENVKMFTKEKITQNLDNFIMSLTSGLGGEIRKRKTGSLKKKAKKAKNSKKVKRSGGKRSGVKRSGGKRSGGKRSGGKQSRGRRKN